jgi:glycosyltransferase involved in cell wall biosynthesis
LRIGGGTRIKILEAMATGKVVVSTSIGAEGLDVEQGVHLLIADGTEDFANAIEQALDLRQFTSMPAQARARAEERYSWRAQAQELEKCWFNAASTSVLW